jgi:hypothetical protein
MKKVLLIAFTFSSLLLYTQNTFEKRFTINSHSTSNSVLQLSDESYVLVGSDRKSTTNNDRDVLLLKLDQLGNISWSKHFGSEYHEFGRDVQQTIDNGFIIVGSSANNSSDDSDVYLIKTDSIGNLIWEHLYDIFEYDEGLSVKQTKDSGFIITGESRISNGPNTNHHLLIIKTNILGEIEWQKVFSNDYEGGKSIIQANDNGYIICGYTRVENDDWSNILVMKVDENGDSLWSKNYGGPLKEFGTSIKQLKNNDLIISGYRADTNNINNADSYFVKTNSNGDTLWTRSFNGLGYNISKSVAISKDSNYLFTGYGEVKELNNNNVYLLKMTENGDALWKRIYGGLKSEYGMSVQSTIDNGIIICGIAFDYDTIQPCGKGVYVIKTDDMGNVIYLANNENSDLEFSVFPNPSNGQFHVDSKEPIIRVEIYDLAGKLKYIENIGSLLYEYRYDNVVGCLGRGSFVVTIISESKRSSKKIIIQ